MATCGHGLTGCVRTVPIFNHLSDEQLHEVMQVVHSNLYQTGEHIFRADQETVGLYIVHSGKVRLYRLNEQGKEQLVRLLLPGDFTGELALFLDQAHDVYAEVIEAGQVCRINKADVSALLKRFPNIALALLTRLAQRLDEAEHNAQQVATESVEQRLVNFLSRLITTEERPYRLTLPMKRKDLAAHLGTTPETVSRILKRLEREGKLVAKGHKTLMIHELMSS